MFLLQPLPGPFRGSKQPKCEDFHFWGPFWPPLSLGNSRDGPNFIKNTSTQCTWVGGIHTMHLGPLQDLYGPQKGSFWLQKALLGAPEVLGGPREARFGPSCPPELDSWSTHTLTYYRAPFGPQGALKGLDLAQKGPFGGPPRSSEG